MVCWQKKNTGYISLFFCSVIFSSFLMAQKVSDWIINAHSYYFLIISIICGFSYLNNPNLHFVFREKMHIVSQNTMLNMAIRSLAALKVWLVVHVVVCFAMNKLLVCLEYKLKNQKIVCIYSRIKYGSR